tara:strand:+ start:210213 stop:212792 length:2580 start_codon:yes stop_codon:yes gene_type:complete
MKQWPLIALFLLLSLIGRTQFVDDYSDGDFTSNPTWSGDDSIFIVNSSERLQLNATVPGDAYLFASHGLTQLADREWRFTVQYDFSPSGSNGGETYLTATGQDLSASPDGIYFRIGESGSDDPLELIERDGGVETTIMMSDLGIVSSAFDISVKVIHRANGDWELYTDLAGGSAFLLDNTVNYPTTVLGQYLGFWIEYTSSNVENFQYDNFYAGPIQVDNTPPELVDVVAISSNEVEILFDEGIDQTTGENTANYSVQGIGNPTGVVRDGTNLALFTATFGSSFPVGDTLEITVSNVEDFAGNPIVTAVDSFQYIESQTPVYGDIIINEFMADETPTVGLPETQYVELYNRSNKYFNLNNWKLSDNNSSGTIQDMWLYPGEYLILVPTSGLTDYPQAINVTSWASLNNSGDDIVLSTPTDVVVDELTYTDDWYQDPDKEDGGWSLERKNPELNCSDADNWTASNHPNGGTPGTENSVFDLTPDTDAPAIINIQAGAPNFLTIDFSEGMDSLSLANATITISPSLTIDQRILQSAYPDQMVLTFLENIVPGQVYSFTLEGSTDCSGNPADFELNYVLPQTPEVGDIMINEILFNPVTSGSDYVELYNTSDKYLDLNNWSLANYDEDTIDNIRVIEQNYIMEPFGYAVLTTDSNFQIMQYPYAVPGRFLQMESLPSYNNDSSTVYLGYLGQIMDKVSYSDEWHFSLLQSDDGVSLERFGYDLMSNDSANWHSASETVGFGTPGGENSQQIAPGAPEGTISLSSNSFSPDGDGFQDALLITYEVNEPTLLGDLEIYDDKGRLVKTLLKNHLLGANGTIKWDGTNEEGKKASIGPHIIYFSVFNVNEASSNVTRKVVTVAGQL